MELSQKVIIKRHVERERYYMGKNGSRLSELKRLWDVVSKNPLISTIIASLVIAAITFVFKGYDKLRDEDKELNKTITDNYTDVVAQINTKYDELKDRLNDNYKALDDKINDDYKTLEDNLGGKIDSNAKEMETRIWNMLTFALSNSSTSMNPFGNTYRPLDATLTQPFAGNLLQKFSVDAPYVLASKPYDMSFVVAVDNQTGEEYTASDLVGHPVLIPYQKDGQKIFFCGQFSEEGNWDGRCLINTYKDEKLYLITEALYDNGDLLSCRQAYAGEYSGRKSWYVSTRTQLDRFQSGETFCYPYLDFDQPSDPVTENDILTVEMFEMLAKMRHMEVRGYYHGNTSSGLYNDDTGNAYLIQYFSSGNVQTLYVGVFTNGNPGYSGEYADIEGEKYGKMLGKVTEEQPEYAYYYGPFRDGNPVSGAGAWEAFLTQDRIDQIIDEIVSEKLEGENFACPLTGLYENNIS